MDKSKYFGFGLMAIVLMLSIFLFSFGCVNPNNKNDILNGSSNATSQNISNNFTQPINETNPTIANASDVSDVIMGNNQFALNIYNKLLEDKSSQKDNSFISPLSIYSALSMVYEGASGQTANEMESVLYLPEDKTTRQSEFKTLMGLFNTKSNYYTLSMANGLWVQKDYPLLDSYKSVLKNTYLSESTNLDFRLNPEGARNIINNWISEKTNNLINNLIPLGGISTATKLILTNAIYFKGKWLIPFNKNNTKKMAFYLANGKQITVPTMYMYDEGDKFNYYETKEFKILKMPYITSSITGDNSKEQDNTDNSDLYMLLILPKNKSFDLKHYRITNMELEEWMDTSHESDYSGGYVYLPKFKFDKTYNQMVNVLKAMGIKQAFTSNADFSKMTSLNNLYISSVIHKAHIDVDEKGTKAAAATAIGIVATAAPGNWKEPPRYEFRADHPFLFMIIQKSTNAILFMGRVDNPLPS